MLKTSSIYLSIQPKGRLVVDQRLLHLFGYANRLLNSRILSPVKSLKTELAANWMVRKTSSVCLFSHGDVIMSTVFYENASLVEFRYLILRDTVPV